MPGKKVTFQFLGRNLKVCIEDTTWTDPSVGIKDVIFVFDSSPHFLSPVYLGNDYTLSVHVSARRWIHLHTVFFKTLSMILSRCRSLRDIMLLKFCENEQVAELPKRTAPQRPRWPGELSRTIRDQRLHTEKQIV